MDDILVKKKDKVTKTGLKIVVQRDSPDHGEEELSPLQIFEAKTAGLANKQHLQMIEKFNIHPDDIMTRKEIFKDF